MPAATVTSKGQITIPVVVRNELGLRSGSRVHFVRRDDGSYLIAPATRSVTVLKGCLVPPPAPVSLEQMDEAIAAATEERARR